MALSDTKYEEVLEKPLNEDFQRRNSSSLSHCFPKRYFVAFMLFLGYFILSFLRASLSIGVVEMTSNKTIIEGNRTIFQDAEFHWNSKEKSLILSMSTYGAFFSIFMGEIAKKVGGSSAFSGSIFMSSLITMSTPYLLGTNFYVFLFFEGIQGFFENFIQCCVPEVWSKWSPLNERSMLMSITFTGFTFGMSMAFPFCGFVTHNWGWRMTFHVIGSIGVIWSIICFLTVGNEPKTDRWISKKEALYLQDELRQLSTKREYYSWKKILPSKAFLCLLLSKFVFALGYVLIFTCLPLYVKDMTKRNSQSVGILSAMPSIANIIVYPVIGYIADYLANRNWLSPTQVHKVFISIGCITGGLLLCSAAVITDFTICLICLVFFKIVLSLIAITTKLLPLYMAPQFPSVIQSFAAFGFIFGNLVGTMFIGFIVTKHDRSEWGTCFISIGLVFLINAIVYLVFGSSEPQSWHLSSKDKLAEAKTIQCDDNDNKI